MQKSVWIIECKFEFGQNYHVWSQVNQICMIKHMTQHWHHWCRACKIKSIVNKALDMAAFTVFKVHLFINGAGTYRTDQLPSTDQRREMKQVSHTTSALYSVGEWKKERITLVHTRCQVIKCLHWVWNLGFWIASFQFDSCGSLKLFSPCLSVRL